MIKLIRLPLALLLLTFGQPTLAAAELTSLRWQQRILLVNPVGDLGGEYSRETWARTLQYQKPALQERKLWVWINQAGTPLRFPDSKAQRQVPVNWADIPQGSAVLIGLDGGIKANYPVEQFSFDAVFSDIDRMPMRQAERQY